VKHKKSKHGGKRIGSGKQVFSVSVLSLLARLSHLIFFGVPPPLQPVRGEALSRGEREIRDEVSFQASQG
jgi:hypothetical protein